jgi:fumarate hydratase class II
VAVSSAWNRQDVTEPDSSDGRESRARASSLEVVEGIRIERDSMGSVEVPADALWRAQTQRAVENFPISGQAVPPAIIHALALVKYAAAKVNAELGALEAALAEAIAIAALAIRAGEYDDQFPIDVFQTGSGTSTNMNVNEVIASLAGRAGIDVHPNDHVNASQSSNDVFPSAIHIAAALGAVELQEALDVLGTAFRTKAAEFEHVIKAGRTHLMDATPVTLGQEFGGYGRIADLGINRIAATLPRVLELPLGGTAVGTGINTPVGFAIEAISHLRDVTGLPFTEAGNHFEAQGGQDAIVELSGQLRTIAVGLTKICNDLRWMGSGPAAGLSEISLPDLQPGSSIMPGKVNPVVPEAVLMVCAQVIGNDAAITHAGAAGNFELNVMLPVIGRNIVESLHLLTNAATLLAERCVEGITANETRMRTYASSSAAIVTPLNRLIGYEAAAGVAHHASEHGLTIREAAIDLGYVDRGVLTEADLDRVLDVGRMTNS